jgi:hypothetical protein
MARPPYTPRDAAVATFIDDFWASHYRSPSLREIVKGCGLSSTSVAHNVIRRLAKRRGDHLATDGTSRGITPKWVREAIANARNNGHQKE